MAERISPEGMRAPRPTIRVLRILPRESFPDGYGVAAIRSKQWDQVNISKIVHPLIQDAQRRFSEGSPDLHRAATQAAGRPVWEVRSRVGAAWRGAVILDEYGDPWLVWAAEHDIFHAKVAQVMRDPSAWLPIPAEYRLRERDEAEEKLLGWRRTAVRLFLLAVGEAIRSARICPISIPRLLGANGDITGTVELIPDPPAEPLEDGSVLAVVVVDISKDSDELLRLVLPVLQPDVARIDATYTREGSLEQWITITQAKLAQLAALHLIDEIEAEVLGAGVGCQVNEELHYVGSSYLADALVFGKSVRAVCGRWFVPTKDAHASLPLCASCERKLPVAQQVAGLIQLFQRR